MGEYKENVVWPFFEEYAVANDISLEHEDDYRTWWDCWYDGFTKAAAILLIDKKQREKEKSENG